MIQPSPSYAEPTKATQYILAPPFVHPLRLDAVINARILIVDDDHIVRTILERMLRYAGFVNIHLAANGQDALAAIRCHMPDLILLDLHMPDMNGIDVCSHIQDMQLMYPPSIVVQTSSSGEEHIINAFHHGAVDYITKPTRDIEIVTRCIAHIERRHLEIERTDDHNRMRSELEDAASLQYDLLPTHKSIHHISAQNHIDIASHTTFSSEMGGDIWGLKQVSEQEIAFHMTDVTGHGLQAALQTFRIHSLMQDNIAQCYMPADILAQLNDRLFNALPTGQFATMYAALLDMHSGMLRYSTAAAPLPMIMRADGEIVELEGSGLPLGCAKGTQYQSHQLAVQAGDTMLIYSDALFESVPDFTPETVVQMMRRHTHGAQALIDRIMAQVLSHMNGQNIGDDLTLIAMKLP